MFCLLKVSCLDGWYSSQGVCMKAFKAEVGLKYGGPMLYPTIPPLPIIIKIKISTFFALTVSCLDGWYSSQGVCMKAFEAEAGLKC